MNLENTVEKQTNDNHPIFNRFGTLSCLDIIKKVRTEGFSNTRKVKGEEFTPIVEMDFNFIIGEKLGDVKCDECGEIQPIDNDFFQEYLQGGPHLCRECLTLFSDKKYFSKIYHQQNMMLHKTHNYNDLI